jgi:hypothetical protein
VFRAPSLVKEVAGAGGWSQQPRILPPWHRDQRSAQEETGRDVVSLPYTRILDNAVGWMNREEVVALVERVRARGGEVQECLADEDLAGAHPDRVHAVLQNLAVIGDLFYEIRLWDEEAGRSFGCPIDLERDEVARLHRQPDPLYHSLVAHMSNGWLTE